MPKTPYELRIGWRYLYTGAQRRSMMLYAGGSAALALVGFALMLMSHGASPFGVLAVLLGLILTTIFALLAWFTVFTSVAVLGVVLGVAALTIVLAVTTGFQKQFRDKVLGVNAHVIVMKSQATFPEYRDVMATAMHVDPDVIAAQPFIFVELLATRGKGALSGVGVKGVDPKLVRRVLDLDRYMEQGSIDSLGVAPQPGQLPAIILGKGLATKLDAKVGDDVTLVAPLSSPPVSRHFRVTGIFYSGFDEYDRHLMYTSLRDLQELLGRGDQVMGVELRLADVDRAKTIAEHLDRVLGPPYSVENWHSLNENLFAALTFQKLALVIILTLIIIVATVNMVSALTMMVTDKTREIAILKSMGATSAGVSRVFLVVGLAIGGVGTLFGIGIGLATCYSMSAFGYRLDPRVYMIDRLPIDVRPFDVLAMAGITLAISLVATFFPSQTAASLTPVEGLRYD